MKLITNYKDYYDHFARDRSVSDQAYLWDRKVRVQKASFAIPTIVYTERSFLSKNRMLWSPRDIEVFGFVLWFCGRVIPVVKVSRLNSSSNAVTDEFYYSFDSIPEGIIPDEGTRGMQKYTTTMSRFKNLFSLATDWNKMQFNSCSLAGGAKPAKMALNDMHRALGSPVFCHAGVVSTYKEEEHAVIKESPRGIYSWRLGGPAAVTINPRLTEIDFQKFMAPFDVFNAIERFVANELAPRDGRMDKPIPDKLKAQSHGFDKHSFRKEPSSNKRKR